MCLTRTAVPARLPTAKCLDTARLLCCCCSLGVGSVLRWVLLLSGFRACFSFLRAYPDSGLFTEIGVKSTCTAVAWALHPPPPPPPPPAAAATKLGWRLAMMASASLSCCLLICDSVSAAASTKFSACLAPTTTTKFYSDKSDPPPPPSEPWEKVSVRARSATPGS